MTAENREYPGKSSVRFHMCGVRILMQEFEEDNEFVGKIYIPENVRANYKSDLGYSRVVAVGPDVAVVKVGDIVVSVAGLGTFITDDKTKIKYKQVPEDAIIAIDTEWEEPKKKEVKDGQA